MSNLLTIIGIISTTLVSIWAVSKYIITVNYKLDNNFSKKIIDKIEKEKLPKWIINKNHTIDPKYPDVYEAFTFLEGVPIFFSRGERLLTAGWKSK